MPIKPDRGVPIPMPAYRPYRPDPFMIIDAQNEARDLAARELQARERAARELQARELQARERAARELQARDTMQEWQRYDAYFRQLQELQMRKEREWIRRDRQQAEARMLAMPKDHWVIENDTLSGVFDGHAVSMSKKDGQDIWEKINKMTIAQKRDYWASRPTWMRRVTLVMLLGREPMAHEVAEPFFLAPHMHSREERSPVVLYGYNCSQRADRSTICMPLK